MRKTVGSLAIITLAFVVACGPPPVFQGVEPQPVPPVNQDPTLSCRAERTTLRVGESVRLTATAGDPDSDDVTVTWAAPAGRLSETTGTEVTWSSEGVRPGRGSITASADDGYGGTASCSVSVNVEAPPPPPEPVIRELELSEFASGTTRLDNRMKAVLDDVALQMRQNPQATVEIIGHSDSTGSEDNNVITAQRRADSAAEYLMETHGIDGSRIAASSVGSSQPIADNSTRDGREQNRRVQIILTIPPQ
jgi:outer membrane protein OmpA-like peptidoglycan-associated protein